MQSTSVIFSFFDATFLAECILSRQPLSSGVAIKRGEQSKTADLVHPAGQGFWDVVAYGLG